MAIDTSSPTAQPGRLAVGEVIEDWTGDTVLWEYSQAADPIGAGYTSLIPARHFPAALHSEGPTRVIPLDLSDDLHTAYPATGPSLLANFMRIERATSLHTEANASSELLYCLHGKGHSRVGDDIVRWGTGDFLTLPGGSVADHHADEDTVFYYVLDTPLLDYLGATATTPRFALTRYDAATLDAKLAEVASEPGADRRSRVSVLLNNRRFDQTLTVTNTLWAMYGLLPKDKTQLPHRHQSIALDLIVECQPGCYSLVGEQVDPGTAEIIDPIRVDWEPGGAFVTPPGLWHSHHNESGSDARLIPIQDAGLHTYLRTLDIRFTETGR